MNSRTYITFINSRDTNIHYFNIPVECIRKTRSLNIDKGSGCVSWQVYKILNSRNGRKIFAPYHGQPWV